MNSSSAKSFQEKKCGDSFVANWKIILGGKLHKILHSTY